MLSEFLLLATAHVFAVASPGADFALVLKNTLRSGKSAGLATAIGVGLGILVHMAYTLFGVAILLSQSEILFRIVKYSGAIYLLWLGYQCFSSRSSKENSNNNSEIISLKFFDAVRQGFVVNVLNPKVTLFFVALFTTIVSATTPLWVQSIYAIWLSVYTMLWFALVAWGFSRKSVLIWYRTHGHYIDWVMGGFLVLIAVRLLV